MVGTTVDLQNTIIQYTADGVETEYTYPFYIPTQEDIQVYVTLSGQPVDPEADILVLNVDYTVQDAGNDNGGTITLTTAAANDATVTLSRNVLIENTTEYADVRNFNGQNLDNDFQKIYLILQQLNSYYQDRGLSIKINSYVPDTGLTQLDFLQQGYIWRGGPNNTIVAAELEEDPDVSTLRSELENEGNGTAGSLIVGYWDNVFSAGTTVYDYLHALAAAPASATDGARRVGFYDNLTGAASSVTNALIRRSLYGVDTSVAANTITVTLDSSYTSYKTGDEIKVKVANANTGATTININGIGSVAVVRDLGALIDNELLANGVYTLVYNGTAFVVQNPSDAYYGCTVYITTPQSLTINTPNLVQFDTIESDLNSIFNTTTHQFLPTRAGWYEFKSFAYNAVASGTQASAFAYLYKNNVEYKHSGNSFYNSGATNGFVLQSIEMYLTPGDYATIFFNPVSFSGPPTISGQQTAWAQMHYIGR